MNVAAFAVDLAVTFGVLLVVFVASWRIGVVLGRFNVVDVTWGVAFVITAVTALGTSLVADGTNAGGGRQALMLAMVTVWGLRLAAYIGWRSRGHGEDPRYEAMLSRASGSRARYALTNVFLVQAAVAWFVSFPVQAAMFEQQDPGPVAWVGVAVWVVGLLFEAVGDAQMAAFKRDPANRGKVMDRGLWRYTRHPNYFGDACVWVAFYLVAASQWVGALTVLSPAVMVYFLVAKTGKPLLEKAMSARPGYAEYTHRTSAFFPLAPRR